MGGDDQSGKRDDAARTPERPERRARVTLNMEGPTLSLPGETPLDREAVGESQSELTLDAADLESVRPPPRLDLDLSELDALPAPGKTPSIVAAVPAPGPSVSGLGLDAWARDKQRRGSYAPASRPTGPPSVLTTQSKPTLPVLDDADGDVLGLVDRFGGASSEPPADLEVDMNERFALDDFSGALTAAELVLGRDPGHARAVQVSAVCRAKLVRLYASRLGSVHATPRVIVDPADVRWLGIDHRAGFLLSRIDGAHTVEEIIDISGMGELEALKMLTELVDAKAIVLA